MEYDQIEFKKYTTEPFINTNNIKLKIIEYFHYYIIIKQ